MSDVAGQTLAGLPLTTDFPLGISEALENTAVSQRKQLEDLGLSVTGIHMSDEDAPPRFLVQFPPGKPSFQIRTMVEAKGFDIGQQMGEKMLRFYATKRVTKTNGWNT